MKEILVVFAAIAFIFAILESFSVWGLDHCTRAEPTSPVTKVDAKQPCQRALFTKNDSNPSGRAIPTTESTYSPANKRVSTGVAGAAATDGHDPS